MDAKNAQRREELKALIDERFQGVVSDRAYKRLKDVVGTHREQPFEVPGPWLQFTPNKAQERRKLMSDIRVMIRTLHPNFELQHRHAVAIMMACPEMIGPRGLLSHGRPPQVLLNALDNVFNFQRHFVQQNAPEGGNSGDVQQEDGQADNSSITRKSRSKPEREECHKYDDGMCIVTKTAHPHVCHIVPFSFNSSKANAEKTKSYIDAIGVMFGQEFHDRWRNVIANPHPHGRGYSDKHWNMLCLSPQLHDWWGRGYFAFEYIKSVQYGEDARIELEFHWMPITTFSYHDRKGVTAHWDGIQDALRHHHATQADDPTTPSTFPGDHHQRAPGFVKAFLDNGEPLTTGYRVYVWRPQKVVGAFKAMVDLQYAAIKMLALCGGAGNPDLLGKDDDDDTVAGASVSSFNAFVQSVGSTEEPDVQLDGLRI
ncbi:uncharacterized protein FMAN_13708 [Fusarium mangiferae]|uniref:HNH nuclease domain-containing protein n=1 Tax=Fusarium mangiferae TaxID=192010 RepID=A0A1L7TJF2_FUSMA|nr:uncharacterized protein FMAN_13708 [Fusarium mangiferae]CVK95775.1 uncharacterized protein FMAN_13708 [Fusarium mangiferae]